MTNKILVLTVNFFQIRPQTSPHPKTSSSGCHADLPLLFLPHFFYSDKDSSPPTNPASPTEQKAEKSVVYDIRVKESKSGKNQSQRAKSKPSTPRIKRIARIVSFCSSLIFIDQRIK